MIEFLRSGISSRNGLIRKSSVALLRVPKAVRWWSASAAAHAATPAVLANSFPKSGTHLLVQIASGLPDRVQFGTFLGSMISSRQYREQPPSRVARFIRGMAPGEVVRGHLFYDAECASLLRAQRVVHYFIYRDPRDVVVSDAHYLWKMNRWHRLHPYFRKLGSVGEAIKLAITGLDRAVPGIEYPNIAERFARYRGWLDCDDCLPVRYEALISDRRPTVVHRMATFYAQRSEEECNVHLCVRSMLARVSPHKSHTFRSGKQGGWKREFTAEHRRLFDKVAGQLLVDLGYESDRAPVAGPPAAYMPAPV